MTLVSNGLPAPLAQAVVIVSTLPALDLTTLQALTERARQAADVNALAELATEMARPWGASWVALCQAGPEGLQAVGRDLPEGEAALSVPLSDRDHSLGMLVWGPREGGAGYPEEAHSWARTVAEVLGQAWELQRVRGELQETHRTLGRRELDLTTLFSTAQQLNSSLSTKTIADTFLISAMGHCAVGAGLVAVKPPEGALTVLASRGLQIDDTLSGPLQKALAGVEFLPNLEEIRPWGAFIQIHDRGEMIGLLALQRRFDGRPLLEHQVSFLQILAQLAGVALQNAALYEDLQATLERERRIFNEREKMRRYLSDATLSEIQRSEAPLALGGEAGEVTVMFADIRGFTSMSEQLPPAEVVRVLNAYLAEMEAIITRYGGTLDKFIGDGIMAVFAPRDPLDNGALRAAKAATAMRATVQKLNDADYFEGHRLAIGIGLNTGEVIAGNIGSPNRMDYTVIGDNVNLAARLESKAQPGQILVSAATSERLANLIPCEFLATLSVKGKQNEVDVYHLPAEG